jgi:hypothetical protein
MCVDQIVHSYYRPAHDDFDKEFKIPKLESHLGRGLAHPFWFLRSPNWDYELLEDLALKGLLEFNYYFKSKGICLGWMSHFKKEIEETDEFLNKHKETAALLRAIDKAAEESDFNNLFLTDSQ